MEDGRPRPSRFERWRASKLPSRHFKPPRDGGLVRRGERSSATHGIVIPDERVCEVRDLERRAKRPQAHKSARSARIQFGQQPSAARHSRRSRFQKHGKSGVTTPTTNLLKMVFWSCAYVIGRDTNVVDPLDQSVTLSYVILLFVITLVIGIAVVAIADHQRLQVARQTASERQVIRPPHLINPVLQTQRH